MNPKRKKAEEVIYKTYDEIDPSHVMSDYYKKIISNQSDEEFMEFCSRKLPFRVHTKVFIREPSMNNIVKAFKFLGVPLMEPVKLPYVYINKDGEPVETQEAMVIYIHLKRLKQMNTIKSHVSMNIDKRDMKTGLLTGEDKGGKETDREFESLATMGLYHTRDEFARPKADAMGAMAQMSNAILNKGYVSEEDITVLKNDSLGKNLWNAYLIGAHIHSNLIDTDYMTPYTAKNRKQFIRRT